MGSSRVCSWLLPAVLACGACGHGRKPTPAEATPAVGEYLVAKKKRTCGGTVTLETLTVDRVDEHSDPWGGFPVFATFAVRCQEGASSSTWNGGGSSKAMTALVRRTKAGRWEAFIPPAFEQAEADMQRELDRAVRNAR